MKLKLSLHIAFFALIFASATAQTKKPLPKQANPKATEQHQAHVVIGQPSQIYAIKSTNDSLSYAIGMNIGQSLKAQGLDAINLDLMKAAMSDILNSKTCQLTQDQMMPVIMGSMKKMQEKKYAGVKTEGEKFLTDNAKKEGVISLPSGLQYSIMKKGEGEIPKATDKVNVHYHGTLINGKVFDSSVDRGTPASFGVTQVIAGWVEALQLMPVGSKWKLYIPQALAYGERGAGENIPPFSTLIFEVELLGIEKPAAENK
jgi:FKBP-type peptidyl-prolyl cis-trans isomerase FklB